MADVLDETARQCRESGLTGWPLVDLATKRVATRFGTYSVLHPWESPRVAFTRGRGYCTQYNGALTVLLRQLGVPAQLVMAARVRFADQPDWALGHVWVRARVDGQVRDVCAARSSARAGEVGFVPLSPVRRVTLPVLVATSAGSYVAALLALGRARLRGADRPTWVEHDR